MAKHSGPNKMLLVATLVSVTLGLTSTVGVRGAFAGANDDLQAPRVIRPEASATPDPLQAPRGQDMQAPRGEVGRGVGNGSAAGHTAEP